MKAKNLQVFIEDLRKNGVRFDDGSTLLLRGYEQRIDVQPIYTWGCYDAVGHASGPLSFDLHLVALPHPTKCRYAKHYKAVFKPRCFKGEGCDACWAKWDKKHPPKPPKVTRKHPDPDVEDEYGHDDEYYGDDE